MSATWRSAALATRDGRRAHVSPSTQDYITKRERTGARHRRRVWRHPPRSHDRVYPATINSEREAAFAADVADALVGPRTSRDSALMGSEDFSFMPQRKPGAYTVSRAVPKAVFCTTRATTSMTK
jgi:metal-dependent amidase/aminoacylase/carboxypeptidase family protein